MRTRDELETALTAAGWTLIGSPQQVGGGWKATIQRGTAATSLTASTEIGVLEDLLRYAQTKRGR